MGRTLDEVLLELPDDRRQAVEARAEELLAEVEEVGLGDLYRQ